MRNSPWVPRTVLHIPHASTHIPIQHRSALLLSNQELEVELVRMTDSHTDELFRVTPDRATTVQFGMSRLVVDPERFLDDDLEPMSRPGMGVVYTRTSDGRVLRTPPSPSERKLLVHSYYDPHHARLTDAVDQALQAHGRCLLIDCHSFPSVERHHELYRSSPRPEICLGTLAFLTPELLVTLARSLFEHYGFSVAVDRPYSGTSVPLKHYRTDGRVMSLMVEVNRGLYMDKSSALPLTTFEDVRQRILRVLLALGWASLTPN